MPLLTPLRTIKETENFVPNLCGTLENALKAVRKCPNKQSGRSVPWWTSECKSALLEYHEAIEETERVTLAWAFRNTVASAKREHWKRKREDIKFSRDALKLMKWWTLRHACITPLRHEG